MNNECRVMERYPARTRKATDIESIVEPVSIFDV